MIIREAIILAGGLGTRLQSVVSDVPKCMAPVHDKPFLSYVLDHMLAQGIEHFIFALGYKHESIVAFLEKDYPCLLFKSSIENEPLGTGGAIKKACEQAKDKSVLIVNGDTLFKFDLNKIAGFHIPSGANCTLSLKPLNNFDRYGVVEIDKYNVIKSFKEKQRYDFGLINAGVYALHINKFLNEDLPEKFSFEKDYLEMFYKKRRMFGVEQDEYFIDIGVPEDYERAKSELK